jgi:hypothetical protein
MDVFLIIISCIVSGVRPPIRPIFIGLASCQQVVLRFGNTGDTFIDRYRPARNALKTKRWETLVKLSLWGPFIYAGSAGRRLATAHMSMPKSSVVQEIH